jgi:hypothetical protein
MKKILFSLLLLTGSMLLNAQDKKLPPLDSSPMDMAYFPVMYPYVVRVKGDPGQLVARVIYSRPQKKGRKIFGDLEPYGELYRLGANEATEIEFYRTVTIGGKVITKGRYTMYSIPDEKKWTIILNRDTDIWGAFKYDKNKDVVRTDIDVIPLDTPVDPFTMVFEKATYGANLIIAWDTVSITLPVKWSDKVAPAGKKK